MDLFWYVKSLDCHQSDISNTGLLSSFIFYISRFLENQTGRQIYILILTDWGIENAWICSWLIYSMMQKYSLTQRHCHEKPAMRWAQMSDFLQVCVGSKWSLKVIQYHQCHFRSNHATSFTKTNPPIWAIWSSKGFRIHPHIDEKRGTLLL